MSPSQKKGRNSHYFYIERHFKYLNHKTLIEANATNFTIDLSGRITLDDCDEAEQNINQTYEAWNEFLETNPEVDETTNEPPGIGSVGLVLVDGIIPDPNDPSVGLVVRHSIA